MAESWERAANRRAEFDAQAIAFDAHRPRYPEMLFDEIVRRLGTSEATVVEVGAGTGIATEVFARRRLRVLAIEPAPAMAAIAERKLGDRGEVIVSTFEDCEISTRVDLVAAFTSWHWVDPRIGIPKAAALLRPGGLLALTWTEIQQFGPAPFDSVSGLEKRIIPLAPTIEPHLRAIEDHGSFSPRQVARFRFERTLDADEFIAMKRTYPGPHSRNDENRIRSLINDEYDRSVRMIEDAVLHLFARLPSPS